MKRRSALVTGLEAAVLASQLSFGSPAFAEHKDAEHTQITHMGKNLMHTDWSYDGQWIAFGISNGYLQGEKTIWVVPAYGGDCVKASQGIAEVCYGPHFKPNSNEISFTCLLHEPEGRNAIVTRSLDQLAAEPRIVMVNAQNGVWSPSGKYMAYWTHLGGGLGLSDVSDEKNPKQIFDLEEGLGFSAEDICFSPDEKTLATGLAHRDPHKLYSISIMEGPNPEPKEILSISGLPRFQKYSPDGQFIMYLEWNSKRLWMFDSESKKIEPVFPDLTDPNMWGSFSPNGSKICYIRTMKDGTQELFVAPNPFYTPTSVNEKPTQFSLSQNHPNPFNPSTTIEYSIPERTHVELTIYDSLGRVVERLVDETKEPGHYRETFRTKNHGSGVYFYQLWTPIFASEKKMLLLK